MQTQLTAALSRMYADKRVKVKFTLQLTMKAQAGSRGIAYSFFNLGSRWDGWATTRSGRFIPGKETRYPLYRGLGGLQGRSGRVRKFSPLFGFDPRSIQPVASRYAKRTIPVHIYAHTLLISMSGRISTAIIEYNIHPDSYDLYLHCMLRQKTEFGFLVQAVFSQPQL
jgi:hypothetical protein